MFTRPIFKSQAIPNVPPLRFPQKLWKIANECQSGAVCWSPDGKSILLRYSLFKEEFMSTKSDFFKTDNISSFVRQLNLYGFRKVYDHAHKQGFKANPDLHEFSNYHFQRDRPDLLDRVTRKSGVVKEKNENCVENQKTSEFMNGITDDKKLEKVKTIKVKSDLVNIPDVRNEILIDSPISPVLKEYESDNKENIFKEDANTTEIEAPVPSESAIKVEPGSEVKLELVKKKRGRKPGSKRDPNKPRSSHQSKFGRSKNSCHRNDMCPILKHPENYPNLIYYDDDDDKSVYLRNTSRDVMLSSTLPFQESLEYLELKEAYHTMYDGKDRFRYPSLSLTINKFPWHNRSSTDSR